VASEAFEPVLIRHKNKNIGLFHLVYFCHIVSIFYKLFHLHEPIAKFLISVAALSSARNTLLFAPGMPQATAGESIFLVVYDLRAQKTSSFTLGKHRFARQGQDHENNRPRQVEDTDSIFDIGARPSFFTPYGVEGHARRGRQSAIFAFHTITSLV
jgi:hypothetical protein